MSIRHVRRPFVPQPCWCPGPEPAATAWLSQALKGLANCPRRSKELMAADTPQAALGAEQLRGPDVGSQSHKCSQGGHPWLQNQTSWPATPDAFLDPTNKSVSSEVTDRVLKCKPVFSSKRFKLLLSLPRPARPEVPDRRENRTLSRRWISGCPPPNSFNHSDSTQMFFLKCKRHHFLAKKWNDWSSLL